MTSAPELPPDVADALGRLLEESFGHLEIEPVVESFARLSVGDLDAAESIRSALQQAEEVLDRDYDTCFQNIDNGIESWTGDAANAFAEYMGSLQTAVKDQMIALRHMQGLIVAFTAIPKFAQEKLVTLGTETADAFEALPDAFDYLLGIVDIVLNAASVFIPAAGSPIEQAITNALSANSAASSAQFLIGGTSELEIIMNYHQAVANLETALVEEVGNLRGAIDELAADLTSGKVPEALGAVSPTFDGETPFDPAQFTLEDEADLPADLQVSDTPLLEETDGKNEAGQ
jgi:hypothetical protein